MKCFFWLLSNELPGCPPRFSRWCASIVSPEIFSAFHRETWQSFDPSITLKPLNNLKLLVAIIFGSWGRGETKRLCGRIFVQRKNTGKWTAGTYKAPNWKGKSSEANLHDFGFQPLILHGVLPHIELWNKNAFCLWLVFKVGTLEQYLPEKNTGRTHIHPWSLTWNLKISPWKRRFPLETITFRFPEHWYKVIQVAGRCQDFNFLIVWLRLFLVSFICSHEPSHYTSDPNDWTPKNLLEYSTNLNNKRYKNVWVPTYTNSNQIVI